VTHPHTGIERRRGRIQSQRISADTTNAVFGTQANAWTEEEGSKLYFQKVDQQAREELPCEGGDCMAEQMTEFARCIRDGATPETGGPEGIEVVAVLEAVIESAATGQAVDVSDYRG